MLPVRLGSDGVGLGLAKRWWVGVAIATVVGSFLGGWWSAFQR